MNRTFKDLLTDLERAVAEADPSTIAMSLGELEHLKAVLWHRLAAEAGRAAPAPPAGGLDELRHLTPQQVGELLNLTPAYVHELCRTRRLPAMKSGKYWMIPEAALRRWLASRNGDIDAATVPCVESPHPRADTAGVPARSGRRRQMRPSPTGTGVQRSERS